MKNTLSDEEAKVLGEKIQNVLSRVGTGVKPWEMQYLVDPEIGLTNPNTVFKDYSFIDQKFTIYSKNDNRFLQAYFYETNSANLKNIIPKIKQAIEENGYKDQLLSVSFTQDNPTVMNDEKLTEIAVKTLKGIYGKNAVTTDYGQMPYSNDDFTYFQQKIPSVYFFLGGSDFEKGIIAMNHTPDFQVDEKCIRTGVNCFSSLILERLSNKGR